MSEYLDPILDFIASVLHEHRQAKLPPLKMEISPNTKRSVGYTHMARQWKKHLPAHAGVESRRAQLFLGGSHLPCVPGKQKSMRSECLVVPFTPALGGLSPAFLTSHLCQLCFLLSFNTNTFMSPPITFSTSFCTGKMLTTPSALIYRHRSIAMEGDLWWGQPGVHGRYVFILLGLFILLDLWAFDDIR